METLYNSQTQSWLSWFFRGLMIIGFLVLLGRLVDLQVIRGGYFRSLAEGNRIRKVPIIAARGEIIARGGEILVGNREIRKKVTFSPTEGYEKSLDIKDASEDEIISEYVRDYRLGSKMAHVSGYLGKVNEEEAGKVNALCLDKGPRSMNAYIGRTGLEEEYECRLQGTDGEELVEVDASGKRVRTLGRLNPIPGEDIKTTIHFGLQNYIADILSGKKDFKRGDVPLGELKAAALVTDTNGEILALYSSPSFDPNKFVNEDSSEDVAKVLLDKRLPLFNRAIAGVYHPGSVFKPVVAIAALEENVIDDEFIYEDTGSLVLKTSYGTFTYNNWYKTQYGGTEGNIGIQKAIARSTDTFFYKVGEMTGMDALVKWTERFGFGLPTEIDLPGEVSGLVSNPEWKKLAQGERWFLGNTYHFSIGQGDTVLTPLQINTAIAAIASGGKLCRPHFVGNADCEDLNLNKDHMQTVVEGMLAACSNGGTAFTFFDQNDENSPNFIGKKVACKTGTAEVGNDGKTHAWFTFFSPLTSEEEKPDIVVTVLVEEGGEGSKIAGPIARSIYDYWFGILKE